jgi:predicted nucleic acid-binding Zn ribbon protein
MATFDYICDKCGSKKEVLNLSINVENVPSCCGTKMRKLPSIPNIKFNCMGFYATDYGGKLIDKDYKEAENQINNLEKEKHESKDKKGLL